MACFSSVVCQCAADIERLNGEHGHEKQALVPQSGAEDDDEDVEEDEEEGFGKFTVLDPLNINSLPRFIYSYIFYCHVIPD